MRHFRSLLAALLLALPCMAIPAQPAAKGKTYATPELAATDLAAAVKVHDSKALAVILGPDARALLSSGDQVADHEDGERFTQAYEEAHGIEKDAKAGETKAWLTTGKDGWPFPIPLVKEEGGWRFDTAAGREEILNRRIGRNETYAALAALAYVDAQREYYVNNPQKAPLLQYAQKFSSASGRRDGLYYPTKAGEAPSPLGPLYDSARAEGYARSGAPAAYHGYRYRILKGQGKDAAGGAYDYVAQGAMIGGFGLIAWPASYGNAGVLTFMVNHDGVLYGKDLGPQTEALARRITQFNPDSSWKQLSEPGLR